MKLTAVYAIALSLLLLNGSTANGQFQTSLKTSAAYERTIAYESGKKASELNPFTVKASKSKRFAVRRISRRLSGKWKGILYQPTGTLRTKFNFTIRLYRGGRKVTGFSRITITDAPQYYGVMNLRGTIRRNRLSFAETKITQENPEPDSRWCIKSGKLKASYIKGRLMLKGNWQAPDCSPGTIILTKVSRQ
jgi:hypothetical protein